MFDNKGYSGSENDITGKNEDKKCDHEHDDDYTFEFEDALDIIGHGSYSRCVLAVLAIVLLAAAVDMFGFPVLVFASSCDLRLTLYQKTVLNSMPFAGPIVMSYAWGYFADTQGRRKTLVCGLGSGMLFAVISCFSRNWLFLAITKLISVSLSCCAQSTTYTLLGESCARKKRDSYMIVMSSFLFTCQGWFYGLSYCILPLNFSYDMGVLGSFLPWKLLSLIMTLPMIIGFTGMLFLYESPKFLVNQGRQEEGLKVMKDMWIRNGGSPDMFQIKKITLREETPSLSCKESFLKSLWHQTAPLFKPPLLRWTLQLFYISAVMYAIANGFLSWFPFFVNKFFSSRGPGGEQKLCELLGNTTAREPNDVSELCATTFQDSTVVAGIVFSVCSFLASSSVILIPTRKKLASITIYLISAASAIGLLYSSEPLLTIALYIAMSLTTVTIAQLFTYYVELYPTSHRGMAACLGVSMARLSSLAGSNLVGTFVLSHCEPTFYGACAFALSHGFYDTTFCMVMSVIMFAMSTDMYSVNLLIIGSDCEFRLTMTQKSLLAALPLIGPPIMAYPWGYISDTQGRRKSMLIGLSLACLFAVLSAFSPNWIILGILKTFCTGFSSCAQSGTYTLVGETCIQRLRELYMLLISSFMVLMTLISNLLAYFVLDAGYSYDMGVLGLWTPWRTYALAVAVPSGLGALLLLFYNESPMFFVNIGREKDALDALKNIWTRNGGVPNKYPVKKLILRGERNNLKHDIPFIESLWQQVVPLFKRPLLYRTLQLYFLLSVVYSTVGGVYVWFPFIVNAFYLTLRTSTSGNHGICDMLASATGDRISANSTTAIVVHHSCNNKMELNTALASVSQAFIYGLVTLCVYKFAAWKRLMLMSLFLVAALGGVGVTLIREPFSAMVAFLTFALHGLSVGILSSYFVDLFPTSYRGMAACLGVVAGRCSMLAASGLVGGYISSHCRLTFLAFSVYILGGVVVAWYLPLDRGQRAKC